MSEWMSEAHRKTSSHPLGAPVAPTPQTHSGERGGRFTVVLIILHSSELVV